MFKAVKTGPVYKKQKNKIVFNSHLDPFQVGLQSQLLHGFSGLKHSVAAVHFSSLHLTATICSMRLLTYLFGTALGCSI